MVAEVSVEAKYVEAGNWARHYSNIRMALVTLLIGASITVAYTKWEDAGKNGEPGPLRGSAWLWLFGVGIFYGFSIFFQREFQYHTDLADWQPFNKQSTELRKACEQHFPKRVPFEILQCKTLTWPLRILCWPCKLICWPWMNRKLLWMPCKDVAFGFLLLGTCVFFGGFWWPAGQRVICALEKDTCSLVDQILLLIR